MGQPEEVTASFRQGARLSVMEKQIELVRDVRTARQSSGAHPRRDCYLRRSRGERERCRSYGNDALKLIAHELLESLQGNVTVDWSRRESARGRMRVLVKRILRKHGYPPDLQDEAVQTVLRQAEALSASWVA